MEPRGLGRIAELLLALVSAPFRAAGELFGLFAIGDSSSLTEEKLASRSKRRRNLIAGIPAVAMTLATLALVGLNLSSSNRFAANYTERLISAISQANSPLASRLGLRVFQTGVRNLPGPAMDYCNFLASQKDLLQANGIIQTIAPDDTPGFPLAHAQRAIAFSNLLSQGASDRYLPVFQWHLKQAGEPSTEALWIAWANYHRLTGQIDRCVQSLESAANVNPAHWFSVADLYALDGKAELARRALTMAASTFRLNLGKDPLSIQDRLQLSMAQARSGEYQQAAETIRSGLELLPGNEPLLQAQSQLDAIRLEQSLNQAPKVAQKIEIAKELLAKSQDPSGTYQKAVEIYKKATNSEDKELISRFLDDASEKYGPNPSLMFSQSVILVAQGALGQARAKLQETIDAFPDHGLSLNNLAWLLATEEPKDLEKAKSFAQRAIATNPQVATFHDTLGTIHLELGDWRSAVEELEIALSQTPMPNRAKIHEKLAKAYSAIGDQALASLHRERSAKP